MKKSNSLLLWLIALLGTLAIAYYQRRTGPTYPLQGKLPWQGTDIAFTFQRSQQAGQQLVVKIAASGMPVQAWLEYRRYRFATAWTVLPMEKREGSLLATIPGQAAAAKIEYRVRLKHEDGSTKALPDENRAIVRFRGAVPVYFLIPHILFMFLSMVMALRTGLEALCRQGKPKLFLLFTIFLLIAGGLVLGPIVQKYAFGVAWSGFPIGYDLTDNKILLAIAFWLAAFFLRRKSRWWIVAACVLMLVVYLIPHSVLGSELNYKTGKLANVYRP